MVRKIKIKSIQQPTDNPFYTQYKPVAAALKVLSETSIAYSINVAIKNQEDREATVYLQGSTENINQYMLWLSAGAFGQHFTWKYQFTFKKKL